MSAASELIERASMRPARSLAEAWAEGRARGNNFDAIRLAAAIMVLFSHSFLLSTGEEQDLAMRLTGGQTNLGNLGIGVFFVLSGYLIAQSWRRTPDLAAFARNRALRIYPALIVVVLVSVFVIGPALSSHSFTDYIASGETWRYLAHLVFIYEFDTLPQVFEHAAYEPVFNRSLWTLQLEVFCYFTLPALAMARALTLRGCLAVQIACMSILVAIGGTIDSPAENFFRQASVMTSWFYGGALLALAGDRIPLNGRFALCSAAGLVVAAAIGGFAQAFAFLGAYLVIGAAFLPSPLLRGAGRFGDFSYGVYIWGWPVQQIIAERLFPEAPWLNFALALPLCLTIAWASWTFIEKPALALKAQSRRAGGPAPTLTH